MANVYRQTTREEFKHPIMDQVMPIVAFEGQNGLVAGACVLISPFLALTAKHVIEEIHRHFGKNAWKDKNVNLDIYPIQFNTGRIWYVSQVFAWVGTDIAFLRLQPRSEQAKMPDPQFLKVTVDPPAIGSEITALGYPKTEIAVTRNDHEVTALKLDIHPTVSTGTVTKIHRFFSRTENGELIAADPDTVRMEIYEKGETKPKAWFTLRKRELLEKRKAGIKTWHPTA